MAGLWLKLVVPELVDIVPWRLPVFFDSKLDAKLNKEDVYKQATSLRAATVQHSRKCEARFRPS